MCMFSQSVDDVGDTRIFARADEERQLLAYSMQYAATTELAMVLPLPVPLDTPENAVRFINLQDYETLFDDLESGFRRTGDNTLDIPSMSLSRRLVVHDVGDYEASFVPSLGDFARLDARFRLSAEVWNQLSRYRDDGFAVFRLKPTARPRRFEDVRRWLALKDVEKPPVQRVHPMAFEFPRRNREQIYFPTVHVHDGKVHEIADFDHVLYCQLDAKLDAYAAGWDISNVPAAEYTHISRTRGLIDPSRRCRRRSLSGQLLNVDAFIGPGGNLPASP